MGKQCLNKGARWRCAVGWLVTAGSVARVRRWLRPTRVREPDFNRCREIRFTSGDGWRVAVVTTGVLLGGRGSATDCCSVFSAVLGVDRPGVQFSGRQDSCGSPQM